MKASLIIPCFNEAESIPKLFERCLKLTQSTNTEVILVDNGSSDRTSEAFKELGLPRNGVASVRVPKNLGYGNGIIAGLRHASGELIGWTHADLQTDPMDFARALEAFREENYSETVFVKGTRSGRPISDVVFTFGMSVFESALMGQIMKDINAQPTLFHRKFMESWIDDAPDDFSLDLFVYYMAKRNKLKVKRVSVIFGAREFGQSHWNIDWRSKVKFIQRTVGFSFKLRKTFR